MKTKTKSFDCPMCKIVKLYCEGRHDHDLLEKVIADITSSAIIEVEPIKGVRGYKAIIENEQYEECLEKCLKECLPDNSSGFTTGGGAIIQHRRSSSDDVVSPDFYLFFRDRDFDKEIPDKPCLEQDEKKEYCYYSYRNTIENYLFDPGIFYDFLVAEQLQKKYKIGNNEEVTKKFIEAAEKIKYYQAVRHTLGKMRTAASFGTKWVGKSGQLPDSLEKDYCREQALKLIREAVRCTEKWTETEFDTVLANFLQKFDADFMNHLDFLIWFQGKDFAYSLGLIMPKFPMKKYYKFAKERFDYKLYPDLVELRQIIEKNSGG